MSDAVPLTAVVDANSTAIFTTWSRPVIPQPGTSAAFLRGTGGGFSYVGSGAITAPASTLRCTGLTPAGPGVGSMFSTDPTQGKLRDSDGNIVPTVTGFPATFVPP